MGAISTLINLFNSLSERFYDIYLDIYDWPSPFWYVSLPFYYISTVCANIAWGFYYFSGWVQDVSSKVGQILSWSTIWSYITQWAGALLDILQGLSSWWISIWGEIGEWWTGTQVTVRSWIDTAVQGLDDLKAGWDNFWKVTWPDWLSRIEVVESAWDNFWEKTWPDIVSWDWLETWWDGQLPGVQDLINSSLRTWFPFYNDLSRLWFGIAEFFADPEQWLYHALDRIVERFW